MFQSLPLTGTGWTLLLACRLQRSSCTLLPILDGLGRVWGSQTTAVESQWLLLLKATRGSCMKTQSPVLTMMRACSGKGGVDLLQHDHDVLAIAFRPDGKLLASSTLDAAILFWDPAEGELQVLPGLRCTLDFSHAPAC